MSKILQNILSGEYPGINRIVELYEDDIINIAFEGPMTNEIGLRFQKKFSNAQDENIYLQEYFKNSIKIDQNQSFSSDQTNTAWICLYQDAIANNVFLPNNGEGFYCSMNVEELKRNLGYVKSQMSLSFENLISLCESNLDKRYALDCLNEIKNQSGFFESGIVMPQDHISSLYKFRYKIACEHSKFTREELDDYKNCVSNLISSKSQTIGITLLISPDFTFHIFYEPISQAILGILKGIGNLDLTNYHSQSGRHYSYGVLDID